MSKQLSKILTPKMGLCFILLLIFSGTTAALGRVDVALAELVITAVLFVYYLVTVYRQSREAARFLDTLTRSMDEASRESTLNCPFPMVMFRPDSGEVLWSNDHFLKLLGGMDRIFDTQLTELLPGFDTRWLQEGKPFCPDEVRMQGRRYQVYGTLSHPDSGDDTYTIATTYWLDVTDLKNTEDLYHATRPVVAILQLDNYEELYKNQEDYIRASMLRDISQRLSTWAKRSNGFLTQMDRDKYLFFCEEQYLEAMKEEKFALLDAIREVRDPSGMSATLSMGLGVDGDTPADLFKMAHDAVEMAQSRGGDQAVIKNNMNFEFYGGRSVEADRHNKVRSRFMADTLANLIAESSCVVAMGHRNPDMDAVGACVGIAAICRWKHVPCYILKPSVPNPADMLYKRMADVEEYRSTFLDSQAILEKMGPRTLLVVADTSRPEQVIDRSVLNAATRVAVIDHHRKAATYIEGPALSCLEPYASSACEMVSEIISYLMRVSDLLPAEAEALLSGMMLDTKNFTMRTGVGTFEAAAMLRRAGGDTARVRSQLFQTRFNDAVAKYGLIQAARMYGRGVAIATSEQNVGRVIAAQAADELLTIDGVGSSFVLYTDGEQVYISGRSKDNTNCQLILEKMGGGGNANVAGAQVSGRTVAEVTAELTHCLDRYFQDETASPEG